MTIALNSVNTNIGAQIALQSLNSTASQLQATQKRISTGLRVSDATDDGAAYAVAQRVRSDVGGLTTVNQQLGAAKGVVGVANTALSSISDKMVNDVKTLLTEIGNQNNDATTRANYVKQFGSLVSTVADYVDHATSNGQSLLGKTGGTYAAGALDKSVISSETGDTLHISGADTSGLASQLASMIGATFSRGAGGDTFTAAATDTATQSAASTALSNSDTVAGSYANVLKTVNTEAAQAGDDSNRIDATVTFNSAKIDSLNAGLGALVDADLSKESAKLQALQIKQQLGTQALSMANQAPQSLLSLFK